MQRDGSFNGPSSRSCGWRQTLGPKPLTANDVLDHLNRTITWYRHVDSAGQAQTASENLLLQDNVQESSKRAVELAFAFARAEAAILESSGQDTANTAAAAPIENRTLQQAALTANQRVTSLQSRIESLNGQIEKQTGRKRATLVSQRDTFAAYLELAKESQQAIRNMMSFANAPSSNSPQTGLLQQINELANSDSVPSALNPNQKGSLTSARVSEAFHPESAGIVTLLAKAVSIGRNQDQVTSLITETNALLAQVDSLKLPLRADLRSAINDGNTIVSAADTQNDPAQLAAARKQINDLAVRFKNASSVMTPLGEQGIVLEGTRGRLQDWRNALGEQQKSTFRYLAVRLGVLALAIVLLLILSGVWRKGIFKYVREARRRRQLMLVRRFVVGFGIALVVALGFFTSFGSVATIIGFLTAGLGARASERHSLCGRLFFSHRTLWLARRRPRDRLRSHRSSRRDRAGPVLHDGTGGKRRRYPSHGESCGLGQLDDFSTVLLVEAGARH